MASTAPRPPSISLLDDVKNPLEFCGLKFKVYIVKENNKPGEGFEAMTCVLEANELTTMQYSHLNRNYVFNIL